jgi:hypothetical protein
MTTTTTTTKRTKRTILKPSVVHAAPDTYPPETPCTIRCALGELDAIALPLRLWGYSTDDIAISPIEPNRDRWSAQGLEGACELKTTWARAYVLSLKLNDQRSDVYVHAPN